MDHKVTAADIAKMIDHSLLKPEMARQEVEAGCELAKKYNCASACVKPCDVELAYAILKDSDVAVTTVVGFPHGHHLTEIKLREAEIAIDQGCTEIDMVQNIGRLKSGDYTLVEEDIRQVCELAHSRNVIVKVIFENAYLTDEEKIKSCQIAEKAGADFVKTSTGYAPGGAAIPDLKLMRAACSPAVRIKAAGGVRTIEAALAVRAVGTTRFGCTTTAKMMEDAIRMERDGTLVLPDADSVVELPKAY